MKVAIVQTGPEYNKLEKSISKACDIVSTAAKENVNLIVFGECWFCGYPAWLDYCPEAGFGDHKPVKSVWAEMYHNSVDLAEATLQPVQALVNEHDMTAVI